MADASCSHEYLIDSRDPQHPANLICELCRGFYKLGWVCHAEVSEIAQFWMQSLSIPLMPIELILASLGHRYRRWNLDPSWPSHLHRPIRSTKGTHETNGYVRHGL